MKTNDDIVRLVASHLKRSKTDVNKLVDGLAQVIKESCANLDSVAVPGFGTFEPRKKNERIITNPTLGKRMLIPPKIVVNFKVSNVLKKKIK